eukprot:scaffold4186_cov110-Isochrysis_galbana.AAC.8
MPSPTGMVAPPGCPMPPRAPVLGARGAPGPTHSSSGFAYRTRIPAAQCTYVRRVLSARGGMPSCSSERGTRVA